MAYNTQINLSATGLFTGVLGLSFLPSGIIGGGGATGPRGATGAVGPVGPQGVTGPPGTVSGIADLFGDVIGAISANTVVNIQGIPISVSTPSSSQSLQFNAATNSWTPTTNLYNVKAFGAKGDNSTDDTAAIQAAITAVKSNYVEVFDGNETVAGGGTIFFPPGVYVVSSSINILLDSIEALYSNINLIGSGQDATYIRATGYFPVFNSQGDINAQTRSNIVMRDLTIGGPAGVGSNTLQWTPNTVYTAGQNITTIISNRIMTCSVGGTSGSRRPYGVLYGSVLAPQVTLSGTPLQLWPQVALSITSPGSNTTAQFSVSLDGGVTYTITGLIASAATVIPNTGLTAHFGTDHSNAYAVGETYYTPPFGAGFSTVHDTTLTDGSVTWSVIDGGCGFLNQTGAFIHIENCHFVNLVAGVIFDGTEVSVIRDCNFECYIGAWITGGNARLNNGLTDSNASSDQANVVEIYGGSMSCSGVGFAVEYCGNFKMSDTNFEAGVFYGWVSYVTNIIIDNIETEGGGTANLTPYGGGGFFIGEGPSPFNGGSQLYTSNIKFTECLIDTQSSPCITGRQNPLCPTAISAPWVNLTTDNCYLIRNGGVSGVTATGTSPPSVQVMGPPATGVNVLIDVTTGGSVGTALFKWSMNGGTGWQATGVNTSAQVGLTGTNLTAYFSSVGTYVSNNIYNCVASRSGMPQFVGADQANGIRIIDPLNTAIFDVVPTDGLFYSDSKTNVPGLLGLNVIPQTTLDVLGGVSIRSQPPAAYFVGFINSLSVNVDLNWGYGHIMLYGFNDSTGPFSLGGIASGTEGKEILVINPLGQNMTIKDEYSGESTLINRIRTGLGYDLVIPSINSSVNWVKLAYCTEGNTFGTGPTTARWVVIGSSAGSSSNNLPTNPAWNVSGWWIDPVNGHDGNSGQTSGAPLKTWNQLIQLFGTNSPSINQNTTITWLSSQSDNTDPVIFTPYLNNGATVTITGNSTVVATGTLSSVTAMNRATPQLWQANIGVAVAPYVIPGEGVTSTQAIFSIATGVYAWPYYQVSTDVCTFTQPLSFTSINGFGIPNTLSSISNGNAYSFVQWPAVNFVKLEATIMEYNVSTFNNGIQVNNLHFFDPQGVFSDNVYIGNYVSLIECNVDKTIINTTYTTDLLTYFQNCSFNGGIETPPGASIIGGFSNGLNSQGANSVTFGPVIDGNHIINGALDKTTTNVGSIFIASGFSYESDSVSQVGAYSAYGSGTGAALWGPGALLVTKQGAFMYPGTSSATGYFLLKGGMQINSSTTAYSISATGTWIGGIGISPVSLQIAAGPTGFGGVAIVPGGGTISNQKT